jgi:uncharacterized protein (DUF4415 family)/uncharacterized DUF497 family protein
VKIVWDEPKRLANLDKHGLDFADLNETFFDTALVLPSYRSRWLGIGKNIRGVIVVVFVTLGKEGVRSACDGPVQKKGSAMPNTKKKTGYSARDMKAVSNNPEWTKADFAKAKPFAEALPELAASIRRGRGPNKAPTKKLVSLRLSPEVVEHFKSKGPGWQVKIDDVLRKAAGVKR